ncbi:MAG: hypothetical protein KME23_07050 [Goleter apudmare HA4340-LM2]|jgi:hypothetical protein|nr:hypothetical protein [Goleter apudmare HA4340-LM2]
MQIQAPQFIWKHPIIQGEPPRPRYGHSAILYQNSMIVFGGEDNNTGKTLNDVRLLDLTSWTWRKPQVSGEIPTSRSFHTAVLAEDKMLVWGGYIVAKDGGYIFNDVAVHILDLNTWQWSQITPSGTPPAARSHHSAALVKDKLFIDSGSFDIYAALDDLHLLDLTKMHWIKIQVENCHSSALAGLKVRGNTLVKFLGDAAYGGFCQNILTLELIDLDEKKPLKLQWQQADFQAIKNQNNIEDGEYYNEEDEEDIIPCRTIHGYGEFADNLVLFAGMAQGHGVSHITIGDLVLLNLPSLAAASSGTYTAIIPEVNGKFPPPRFGHSTIQYNRQMIVYGGLWIDTEGGNNSYDNDVYILEEL